MPGRLRDLSLRNNGSAQCCAAAALGELCAVVAARTPWAICLITNKATTISFIILTPWSTLLTPHIVLVAF